MQWLIIGALILYGVIWLIVQIFEAIGSFMDSVNQSFKEKELERQKKESERLRLKQQEAEKREKLLSEERERQWMARYNELLPYVDITLPDLDLTSVLSRLEGIKDDLKRKSRQQFTAVRPSWQKRIFKKYITNDQREATAQMYVDDIDDILKKNTSTWEQKEMNLIADKCVYSGELKTTPLSSFIEIPEFSSALNEAHFAYDEEKISSDDLEKYFSKDRENVSKYNKTRMELLRFIEEINKEISNYNETKKAEFADYIQETALLEKEEKAKYNADLKEFKDACKQAQEYFKNTAEGFASNIKEAVVERLKLIVSDIQLPDCIPHKWEVDYNPEEQIAIVEIGLPDVVHFPPIKTVELKSGVVEKPLNLTEKKEIVPHIHPAIMLRIAYEIFRNDSSNTIKLLVLNGWIKFDDPTTGINTKSYTASLMLEKSQIESMNLTKIEPLTAFNSLKGKSAGKLVEIVPITPVMSLDKKDKRFIATSEVLNKLGSETNLASMDWKDFESLIAELFEKEFAQAGAEVKVTQASRDRGVDAVIFDPDPIRGGKIIVQAKRYANTVDVSAVRDLCAVVKKEGAIKGILVTTSTYGGDAYKFANNEPVTLLNGAELLGLLKKHGYTFRISLEEAKKLNQANGNI